MKNTNKSLGYIALSNLRGIGPAFIKKIAKIQLFEENDLFNEIKILTSENKKNFEDKEIYDVIKNAEAIIKVCIHEGIEIIPLTSQIYPNQLKLIKDPPPVLYCKGNLELLSSDIVGIIGTREPTATGIEISQRVGAYYSLANWTLCNGLAEGIDSYSIKIGNEIKGNILGVLAGGLNFNSEKTLLKNTTKTAQLVLDNNGILVSETSPGIREDTFSIVKSCRIQAGISKGLILIQSSMKGGSRFATKSFCEISRPLGIIQPIPKDFNLPSYEANKKIIENKEIGLAEFTGLKEKNLNLQNIFIIKSKNDFFSFEEKMRNIDLAKELSGLSLL